jgi:hypothetical protein
MIGFRLAGDENVLFSRRNMRLELMAAQQTTPKTK